MLETSDVEYAAALEHCSGTDASRYAIPDNRKLYRNWTVSQILIETMEAMK